MTTDAPATDRPLAPVVPLVALGHLVAQLAVATRYGFHRDELYFLACARRLAWGYVDQPPFTPALARLDSTAFGGSLVGLRLLAALAGAGVVVLTGLTARELSGRSWAQGVAALVMALSTGLLIEGHIFGPTIFDMLAWAAALLLAVRLLRTRDPRLWLPVGAVLGLGLLNKHTVLFLGFGLLAGLLATSARTQLRSWQFWAGAAIALAIWSPNLLWQATHSWPTLEMLASLHRENGGPAASALFMPMQVLFVNPLLTPIWIAGLIWLLRDPAGRAFRPLGWAYLSLLVLLTALGGKPYYLGPMYVVLVAAGGVVLERALAARGRLLRLRSATLVAAMTLALLVPLPIGLPLLPASRANVVVPANPEQVETFGWPAFVAQVAAAGDSLPREGAGRVTVLTANYGEAGAIDWYGARYGLGPAISGHNSYWLWGPGRPGGRVLAVGLARPRLLEMFDSVALLTHVRLPYGINNQEQGAPVWWCRYPRGDWARIWPAAKHYN